MRRDYGIKSHYRKFACGICGKLCETNNPTTRYCSWKCRTTGTKQKQAEYAKKLWAKKKEEKLILNQKQSGISEE